MTKETQEQVEEVMTPQKLAIIFHDIYETLAPSYRYETRKDTRDFDPESTNGKLMIACCKFILETEIIPLTTQALTLAEQRGAEREAKEWYWSVKDILNSIESGEIEKAKQAAEKLDNCIKNLQALKKDDE